MYERCISLYLNRASGGSMKKYEKVFRKDYENWRETHAQVRAEVAKDPMRLAYHLMPESGWLNDPNGLCQFHGRYHIYYQFTPFEPTGELKLWGHYTTKDFVHYENAAPVLFPDSDADAHGVYSGSAFVKDDTIHYFYTGNVKFFDRDDYDYTNSGRGANVIHVESKDGYHMSEKEVLLKNADYPSDMSCHVRDPKIFPHEQGYYMVLGARDKDSKGLVLVYDSNDLKHWTYAGRITTEEAFGYMWECPDLFALDGQLLLIDCPQGVKPEGIDYANVHQCTVMPLRRDGERAAFHVLRDEIHQLDRGCDFYAPQTFFDEQGRRILIGWMGIPDADYTNPTTAQGWQHALTIPRTLHFENGRLYQRPLAELEALRGEGETFSFGKAWEENRTADLQDNAGALDTEAFVMRDARLVYEANIQFDWAGAFGKDGQESCEKTVSETGVSAEEAELTVTLRAGVALRYADGVLTLDLGAHGAGRGWRSVRIGALDSLRIFSDTSSLEIFVNDGVEVFTTRVYGEKSELSIKGAGAGSAVVYPMNGFVIEDGAGLV